MKPKILNNHIKSLIILFILNYGITSIASAQAIRVPNATMAVPAGPILESSSETVTRPFGNGKQWDINTFDVSSFLSPGSNNLNPTKKRATLIVGLIDSPADAAPSVAKIKEINFDYPPTPDSGHVFNIFPGDNLAFSVSASLVKMPNNTMKAARSANPNEITLSATGLPIGASFPTVSHVHSVTSAFSWVPTLGDVGSRVVTFIANNESNDEQITTSVIINVIGDVESNINAPQNLQVSKISCDVLKLTWNDIIDSFEESYEVYRSSNGPGGPYQLIATPNANAIEFIDHTVWPNATFHYYVRGRFSSGFSPNSNIAMGYTACDGPITDPSGPNGNVNVYPISCSQFSIQWSDVIGRDEESFELYRSENTPYGPYVLVGLPAANTGVWIDGHLESDTKYYYKLRARFGDGFSDYTVVVGATTFKINLRLTQFCATKAVLDWDICTSQREKWRILVSLDNVNFLPLADVDALVNHYEAKNLIPNTKYYFAVQPSYSTGYSNFSNIVEAPLLKFPHPSDLKAAVAGNKVNLSWVDNSSACDNEEQFVVYRKDANDNWIEIGTADANKLAFIDSNVVAGKAYCYEVKARYFMGFEEPSNEACITMQGTAPMNVASVDSKAKSVFENGNANSKLNGDNSTNLAGKENRNFISLLNIYPNPVSNLLKFALNHQIDEQVTVKIFDSMGKEKMMSDFEKIELNKEYEIDISILNEGLFFLSVQPKYSSRPLSAKFSVFK